MTSARTAVLRALALSCHPAPTVAVTVMSTALIAIAGNAWSNWLLAAVAVLSGQLSIGWSNDLIDADRDARAGRSDKPVAAGLVGRSMMQLAIAVALVTTVLFSLALGWRAGLAQLVLVTCGWLYNLGLKSTVFSVLPYVVGFGALPAMATLALPNHPWPPTWALLAGALIGVAAHFANVLPDLGEDDAAGVRGLPHRLGRVGAAIAGALAVVLAALLIVLGPSRQPGVVDLVGLAVVVALAGGGLVLVRRDESSEAAFFGTMAAAAVGVVMIGVSGSLG